MLLLTFQRVILLAVAVSSLSANIQRRRSTLRAWGSGKELGWITEHRLEGILDEVLVGWCDDDDEKLVVKLPEVAREESLSSSLWPAALAGSILLRSPTLRCALSGKTVLELGSGLGLTGLVAAAAPASRCILTDKDEDSVAILKESARRNAGGCEIEARRLEWRDDHEQTDIEAQFVLGTDVAYYYYLLRPLMDTARSHLVPDDGFLYIVGAAFREAQWQLYHNLRDGCYNQVTDKQEPPWPGNTSMVLYDLAIGTWTRNGDVDVGSLPEEILPMAALVYTTKPEMHDTLLRANDHIATTADEETQMMSF